MKLMFLMTEVAEKVATSNSITFGQLAGIALVLLVIYVGFTLIGYGWPDWFKRSKK